jgi:predicted mannosyl-3-phosphoglycerate phosphatase (HAD superfamily)
MSEQPHRGTVVVDLDGTICEHRFPAFGEPIAGAREALQRLKEAGYWIIIFTVRTSSYYQSVGLYNPEVNSPEAVSAYLEQHQIPFDEIWKHDKPPAMVYIDDRALRLEGDRKRSNWSKLVDVLLSEPRKRRLW